MLNVGLWVKFESGIVGGKLGPQTLSNVKLYVSLIYHVTNVKLIYTCLFSDICLTIKTAGHDLSSWISILYELFH